MLHLGPYFHGPMYEDRGEMVSTFIVCYALSSAVAGYASGSYYKQYFSQRSETSSQWQTAMLTTVLLFPSIVVSIVFVMNTVAIFYDTISAIHFSVILKMLVIWLFVSLPLYIVGTLFGRHWVGKCEPPCRVNSIPR